MKIREQDTQHIVIAPPPWERLRAKPGLALFLLIIGVAFSVGAPYIGIPFLTVIALYYLGRILDTKVILDKTTQSITIKKHSFLWYYRKRIILSSAITRVIVHEHGRYTPGPHGPNTWGVYLDASGERVEIAHGKGEWGGWEEGDEISRFIGRGALFPSREEAVARFKKRVEQDAKEGKKQG